MEGVAVDAPTVQQPCRAVRDDLFRDAGRAPLNLQDH